MKFITKEDLQKSMPKEPKFLRWRIFLGGFITATIMGLIGSVLMVLLLFVGVDQTLDTEGIRLLTMLCIMPFFVSHMVMSLFNSIYIMGKRVFVTPKFIQKWLGIYEYQQQSYKYYSLLTKYESEQNFIKSQELYKNYK